ncbi:hypothetical protein KFE25_002068 [Diacronema lutheri]|uniref:Uncharacterized protein n=2 Tax=Diacronema lutheri TaxID=2081491 RepID=A0A8J6C9A9_DIALT|nr:hypothetical protein KFE25_002068 [Diacronema lutheri]
MSCTANVWRLRVRASFQPHLCLLSWTSAKASMSSNKGSHNLYEVVVPAGLNPGDQFIADVNGVQMNVSVPPNVRGGETVRVHAPTLGPVPQGQPVGDAELARQLQAEEDRRSARTGARWRGRGRDVLLVQPPPGHVLVETDAISPAGIMCCVLTCPFVFPLNLLGLLFTEKRLVAVPIVPP